MAGVKYNIIPRWGRYAIIPARRDEGFGKDLGLLYGFSLAMAKVSWQSLVTSGGFGLDLWAES
jgi:hypothetical protein